MCMKSNTTNGILKSEILNVSGLPRSLELDFYRFIALSTLCKLLISGKSLLQRWGVKFYSSTPVNERFLKLEKHT